ncbi:TetR/AcrR family transcriptional regulator [bacterium]|nr:TetR/AcrR family transcriptional regulator [bacterium]
MTQKMNTEARREQIAGAALVLLAERGSEGFNIADLAEGVGLVPSAIYRHFEGREDVLDAALDVFRDRVYGLVEAARNEAEDPLEALELLLTRHARLIESGGAVPHIMASMSAPDRHAARRAKTEKIFTGYVARVERLVRDGQESGQVRSDIDSTTAALLFAGMIQPAALLRHAEGERFDIMAHAAGVWELFRRAVACD